MLQIFGEKICWGVGKQPEGRKIQDKSSEIQGGKEKTWTEAGWWEWKGEGGKENSGSAGEEGDAKPLIVEQNKVVADIKRM